MSDSVVIFDPSKEQVGMTGVRIDPMPKGIMSIRLIDKAVRDAAIRGIYAEFSETSERMSAIENNMQGIRDALKLGAAKSKSQTTIELGVSLEKDEKGKKQAEKLWSLATTTRDKLRECGDDSPNNPVFAATPYLQIPYHFIPQALDILKIEPAVKSAILTKADGLLKH